jgi:hypothetical protein
LLLTETAQHESERAQAVSLAGRSAGRLLDERARAELESFIGHDFGNIRVHTDEPAAEAAALLGADAFTFGEDIFFAEGAYRPDSAEGQQLLVHELTHSLQQGASATIGHAPIVANSSAASEAEADTAAAALRDDTPGGGNSEIELQRAPPALALRASARPQRKSRARSLEPQLPLGPGQILERLATLVVAHFRNDPTDEAGRAQQQLGGLSEDMRRDVLVRVQSQVTEAEKPSASEMTDATVSGGAAQATVTDGNKDTNEPAPDQAAEDEAAQTPIGDASQDGAGAEQDVAPIEGSPAALKGSGDKSKPTDGAEAAESSVDEGTVNKAPKLPRLADGEAQAAQQSSEAEGTAPAGAAGGGARAAVSAAIVATVLGDGAGAATGGGGGGSGGAAVADGGAPAPASGAAEAAPLAAAPDAGLASGPTEAPATSAATSPAAESESKPAAEGASASAADGGEAPGLASEAGVAATELGETDVAGKSGASTPVVGAGGEAAVAGQGGEAAAGGAAAGGAAAAAATSEPAQSGDPSLADESASDSAADPAREAPEKVAEAPEKAAEAPQESTTPDAAAPSGDQGGATPSAAAEDAAPVPAPESEPAEASAESASAGSEAPADASSDAAAPTADSSPTADAEAPVESEAPPRDASAADPTPSAPIRAGAEPGADVGAGAPAGEHAAPGTGASGVAAPANFDAELADVAGGAIAVDAGGGAGGGAAGGGGGGGAVEDKTPPAAPDVSTAEPSQAMGAMAGLPPAQLKVALGAVSTASSRAVNDERKELAANPPSIERPSGAPAEHPPAANPESIASSLPADKAGHVAPLPQAASVPTPNPASPPGLAPPSPLPPTRITAQAAGDAPITADDAARIQSSVDGLPTTDPELDVSTGDAPELALAGDADPTQTTDQRAALDKSVAAAQTEGAKEVAQKMGEDKVYPDVPAETLKAEIPSGGGGGGAGPAAAAGGGGDGGGGVDEETASIVAEAKKGDEIRASVTAQSADMEAQKQAHDKDAAEEKSKTQAKVDDEIKTSADQQEKERGDVAQKVAKHRQDWSKEQEDAVDGGNKDAEAAQTGADEQVTVLRKTSQTDAQKHIDDGNQSIKDARTTAEGKAKSEQTKAKNETSGGGFFSWLGSKVKSFFDGIKQAIHDAFDAARKLVKAAIKKAQELATAVIEKARKAIVDAIHKAGDLLIKIGDTVLAAFPEARDKFRKLITAGVKAAEDAVNKLAEGLRKTIVAALDLLGKALDAYLGLLEKAYMMAVDAVAKVVQGAINFAKTVAQGFAAFAALIKDVAANPGQWLRNLGSSVMDGIKNHLVKAFKAAIRQWFDDTVEQVLGIGKMIIQMLKKGGIPWAKIGSMVWEALKTAIPVMLIELLIEKLVSMIVPAAGAVLAVIQGLQAAWGAVQRIIAAFELFFTFLKAVKGGNAGPQFAAALAAAAIVVIQFVAFWLLRKLMKPAAKIGAKLKKIASKIMAGLKKAAKAVIKGVKAVARAVKKGVKAAVGAIKKGAKAIGKALVKGAKAVGRVLKKIGRKLANTKIGKAIVNAAKKVRAKLKEWKEKAKKKWEAWKEKRKKNKEDRIKKRKEKAERELPGKIDGLLGGEPSRLRVYLTLAGWKIWYRLSVLKLEGSAPQFTFVAAINPTVNLGRKGWTFERMEVIRVVDKIAKDMLSAAEAERDASPAPTSADGTIDLTGRTQPAAALAALKKNKSFKVGTVGGEDLGFQHSSKVAPFGGWFGWQGVAGLGAKKGNSYPQLEAKLAGVDVGAAMTQLMREGKLDPKFAAHKQELSELHGLLVAKEPSHYFKKNARDLVYSTMTTEMTTPKAGQKAIGLGEALAQHPATYGGAQKGARRVTDVMEDTAKAPKEGTKEHKAYKKRLDREIATIKAWFARHVHDLPVLGRSPTLADVEAFVRKKLGQYLRNKV